MLPSGHYVESRHTKEDTVTEETKGTGQLLHNASHHSPGSMQKALATRSFSVPLLCRGAGGGVEPRGDQKMQEPILFAFTLCGWMEELYF